MSTTTAATVIATVTALAPKQEFGPSTTFLSSYPAITYLVTWTNLGPLTTTFTAPPSCSTIALGALRVYRTANGVVESSAACLPDNPTKLPSYAYCQPSARSYSSLLAATTSAGWLTYLSPGLYCPSGYSTATALTLTSQDVITGTYNGYLLRTTGTHVYCCPSGYFSSIGYCVSNVATPISTSLCNVNYLGGYSAPSGALFSWHPQQQATTVQRSAQPVYMIHQQSDVPDKGLSTSSKIAIGVVVPVVILLGIILGGMFFMRRLRKKRASKSNAATSSGGGVAEDNTGSKPNAPTSSSGGVEEDEPGSKPNAAPSSSGVVQENKSQGEESPLKGPAEPKRGWHWV